MEQFTQFISQHPLLTGGFAVALIALIVYEVRERSSGFSSLSPGEAVALINREDAVVLDVSSQADYQNGHIVEARHTPASQVDQAVTRLQKKPDRPVVVVDKNGQQAGSVAGRLSKAGLPRVYVMRGGMTAWRGENYPVTRAR